MSTFGFHVISDAAYAALKAGGHEIETFAASETDKLIAAIKAKFPDVVAGVRKLIADANDTSRPGIDKLEAVAIDAIGLFPPVLATIPEVKTFAISLAQSVFTDGKAELEKVAGEVLLKL
jgi:hypothetical protein